MAANVHPWSNGQCPPHNGQIREWMEYKGHFNGVAASPDTTHCLELNSIHL